MDTAQRAAHAKTLIEDTLFKEAFDMLEKEQIRLFTDVVCSPEQLQEAHRMVRALRMVRDQLTSYIVDGKLLDRRKR
jgi:hypothetical protein